LVIEDLCENIFDISQNSETVEKQNEEISSQNKSVNKGERPRSDIWNYFIHRESDGKGYYNANCQYCIKERWKRGRPLVLESHLALHCKGNDTDHSDDESASPSSKPLESVLDERNNEINKALLKAFVCAGISFSVIDNPFVQDLFNIIEPKYNPPRRLTLAERMLDEEMACITV
ncbi:3879_t:CDS:2, partial [Ambispora leptoticha]